MLSKQTIQKIAWHLSQLAECPSIITYYDLKDELSSDSDLLAFYEDEDNREELLALKEVSSQLKLILNEISSDLDPEDRRRIALFHAMVQFPQARKKISKKEMNNAIESFLLEEGKNDLAYIFLNALKSISSKGEDNQIQARKNLMMLSDILEPDYGEDSLYNHFMKMTEYSTSTTRVPDRMHYVEKGGSNRDINGFWALGLLFEFDNKDFSDTAWIGGMQEFGFTEYLSLRKRKIYEHIKNLRSCNLPESIEYLS